MNISQNVVRILCYGDSNTWGDIPGGDGRFSANVRWTGKLQEILGNKFEIIEEGLCGRTTILDDPKEEGRNGKTYLKPCLETHNPLDLVILMLGTNDLKERFNQTAEQIAKNIEELVLIIKKNGINNLDKSPKIILVAPPTYDENPQKPYMGMKGAQAKSQQFAKYYEQVAKKHGCEFIDSSLYVNSSKIDGCHLEKADHAKIAEVLAQRIYDQSNNF